MKDLDSKLFLSTLAFPAINRLKSAFQKEKDS